MTIKTILTLVSDEVIWCLVERKCSKSFFSLHNKVLGHIRNYEIPHTVQLSWSPQDIPVFRCKHLVQPADNFSSFWAKCTMLAYFIDMSFLSYTQALVNLLSLANTFNVTEHISISWKFIPNHSSHQSSIILCA
jgi:hypothetical protein